MSGLQARSEEPINGVDVREQGSALRVATNTPHLVSLGTGRLSTAVTLHPIKQGRVTIGSDPTCDIYVVGTGVASVHCRVENSHNVVTLYPTSGSTLLDGVPVEKPTRLSQGSMLTIGRSNYLRFNHPEEAKLMKSVLPSAHVSMAPVQFTPNELCITTGLNHQLENNERYQNSHTQITYKDNINTSESTKDKKIKPPVAPRKPKDLDVSDSSDQENKPKLSSIMAKVSKFEYYAKQQKIGKSQFYTNENEISPKVFSSNSLTVNTPAKDVLGGKSVPNHINKVKHEQKVILLNENNAIDAKNCSYANVAIRNKTRIDDIVRNFDENSKNERLPKKINNNQVKENIYGKINTDFKNKDVKNNLDVKKNLESYKNKVESVNEVCLSDLNKSVMKVGLPSPAFDRNPQYSPVYSNNHYERSYEAEHMRIKAYQDRVKEEEQKEAETARLEEILNMCAEYERQIASGVPITPPEKRSQNKIITNGSLPRSVVVNNPNFVQTKEGYYKFDTSHNKNNSMSQSLPLQRNNSSYENFDTSQSHTESVTPEVVIDNHSAENINKMHEIGIPVFDDNSPSNQLSSPLMLRKLNQNGDVKNLSSPMSPYENMYYKNNYNFKPKSPNTQSPRTRIKTSFAHKNLTSPQYFVFPTPPPVDNSKKPIFSQNTLQNENNKNNKHQNVGGIEKQLSLEEEIPMIDDSDITNDLEFRCSKIDKNEDNCDKQIINNEADENNKLTKNQSFDDVKKELMADIPELEEFELDLKSNKRDKITRILTQDVKNISVEDELLDNSVIVCDDSTELKSKYEKLREDRRRLLSEIHEIKYKMTEIRSQEDEILRELEMEKALIKGEYDSEIAILNIEQKKKTELIEKAKKLEEDIKQLKQKQEARQNETRDRVEIATMKVERIQKDIKESRATVEELQNASDILDNETKIFEDLEFQHLEEESELLSSREDVQNEIIHLTKKIEAQKTRILTLKSEANSNLTSALDETKVLQSQYVKLLNQVEELTSKVQVIEKNLKSIVANLNEIDRAQSPDSIDNSGRTRVKSGEFGYSPQSSDSDDIDLRISNYENHTKQIKDKFNSIDQMSQSMIVDLERRITTDVETNDSDATFSESPSKSSTSKEKKGFWERNFDSLKRKKKPKSPEKTDIMSQSLNENMFFNNENIEIDNFDRFNGLRNSKSKKDKKETGPVKSNSSSKIPTLAALGKIIKKDSFGKKSKDYRNENGKTEDQDSELQNGIKNRYVKYAKPTNDNKYVKAKSISPEKIKDGVIMEEINENYEVPNQKGHNVTFDVTQTPNKEFRILHRKSCGDEPGIKNVMEIKKISDSGKIPSQDDIDRISKVTMDAPILSSDTDMNSLGKRTFDSLMEIERKRLEMLEEQGCQVIENEREKISELKKRVQDETKKLWDQKYKSEQRSDKDLTRSDQDFSSYDQNLISNGQTLSSYDQNLTSNSQSFSQSSYDQNLGSSKSQYLSSYDQIGNNSLSSYDQNQYNHQNLISYNQSLSRFGNSGDQMVGFDQNLIVHGQSVCDNSELSGVHDKCIEDSSYLDDGFNVTSSIYEDSSGLMSSSIEELQVRNSRTESTEDEKRSDDSRPLSHASDFSRDNMLSSSSGSRRRWRGGVAGEWQRPLTRYLPVDRDDFDLRTHIDSAGHQTEMCPHVAVTPTSCRGYLHKLGAKFHTWSKRWFVFDRETKTFVYYWDKSEKKPRGGAYFQVIEEVYLDHANVSKSPNPQTTFIVKTRQRRYYLMAPSGEAARIWIDVIFTGAQGYTEYLE